MQAASMRLTLSTGLSLVTSRGPDTTGAAERERVIKLYDHVNV